MEPQKRNPPRTPLPLQRASKSEKDAAYQSVSVQRLLSETDRGATSPLQVGGFAELMQMPDFNMSSKSSLTKLARLHGQLIFVRALRKYTKPQTLRAAFETFGPVLHVHLPFNAKKKANIGYGYVVFLEPRVGEFVLETVRYLSVDGKMIKLCRFTERSLTEGADARASSPLSRPHSAILRQRDASAARKRPSAWSPQSDSAREHSIRPTDKLYFEPLRRSGPDHSFSNVSFKLIGRTGAQQ